MSGSRYELQGIPLRAGVGFRLEHASAFLRERPGVGWLEVHAENYLVEGGMRLQILEQLRRDYPLSIHGVGMSLGTAEGVDDRHLQRVARLVERFEPGLVSEHVAWSVSGGVYFSDLLPLPYTQDTLRVLSDNVQRVQDVLGRQLLVENPSTYTQFTDSDMTEWDFLDQVTRRTGCGLLLDLNNIHVGASNNDFDPKEYLAAVPFDRVHEIHLGGHEVEPPSSQTAQSPNETKPLLIDTHSTPVSDAVWRLLDSVLEIKGPVPTLVEWDADLPELSVLMDEVAKAQQRLDRYHRFAGDAKRGHSTEHRVAD